MALIKAKGIVLKQTDIGNYDKMLTILTKEYGKISACAKGVKSLKSPLLAGAKIFSYSDFVFYEGRQVYTISQCSQISGFYKLSNSLERLEAAAHICSFTDFMVQEHEKNPELLRLLLNSLHALANTEKSHVLIRAVFRIKAMCLSGYEPELNSCTTCGVEEGASFSPQAGGITCNTCAAIAEDIVIDNFTLGALRYICGAPLERVLGFNASQTVINLLDDVSSRFAKHHVGKD